MEKKGYINVDELMPQVSIEQAASYYGVLLPELKKIGNETRTACFLACGKKGPTGDRALAIQADHPAKQFHCHNYGCGKGGNLVSLCDLMKPGTNAGGKPRGERFKDIARDLQAIAEGGVGTPSPAPAVSAVPIIEKVNVPLNYSENERARALTALDTKFVIEVANMNPKAAAYFRRRPYLTPEVCKNWRMGYLPRDTGGEDKSGGTMRGKVVYGYANEAGEVLRLQARHQLFPQVYAFVQEFVAKKVNFNGVDRRELGLQKYVMLAVERLREAIQPDSSAGEPPLLPILNRYRPAGKSGGVDFPTTRPVVPTVKSHVNLVVLHSTWEADAARELEDNNLVKFYVRNDHLGLVIPYEYIGTQHGYEADFLVRLINDLNLLLEIKGYEVHNPEMNNAKHAAAKKWVTAVNNLGDFGRWDFHVCRDLDALGPKLADLAR